MVSPPPEVHAFVDPRMICDVLEEFIRTQMSELGREGAVVGLSGGLDSAVTASLIVRAIGKEKVLGVMLPERDSDPRNKHDALDLAERLGIRHELKNLSGVIRALGVYHLYPAGYILPYSTKKKYAVGKHEELKEKLHTTPFSKTLRGLDSEESRRYVAYYSAKNMLRTVTLYYYANLHNYMVVGTSNKSEFMVGYFVKYGDGAADIQPLLDLYKTHVFALARYLEVPSRIIDKAPSSDLVPGVSDEMSLDIPYALLDKILHHLETIENPAEIASKLEIDEDKVKYVMKMVADSAHLRKPAPYPRIS
jgi:NAD+ synthase